MSILKIKKTLRKKKKIVVISLSVGLVFITLIAGLFLIKKNKESRENNNIGEVVNEDHENNDNNDHENDGVIVNEGDYFFNKTSCQVITNILLSLITGILFFFWENDKLPPLINALRRYFKKRLCLRTLCGLKGKVGAGLFEKVNWFGFGTFVSLIVITLLVEFVLYLLIGSISYLFSKDKNKRYFHTLKMFRKKRKQIFSSLSKKKISFIVLSYLLCGFIIAIVARTVVKRINICCGNEIITGHGQNYCLYWCKASPIELKSKKKENEIKIELKSIRNINNRIDCNSNSCNSDDDENKTVFRKKRIDYDVDSNGNGITSKQRRSSFDFDNQNQIFSNFLLNSDNNPFDPFK